MKRVVLFFLGLSLALAQSPLQQAPERWRAKANPLAGDAQAAQAGAKLFARECAACHGDNGEGLGKAPALKRADVGQAPPGALFWVLENGALWQGMPSFAHLPEAQRWQIITYVQTLSARKRTE